MTSFILDVFKWLVPWLFSIIKDKTDAGLDDALDVLSDILTEMLDAGKASGLGRLSVRFRRPYEIQMLQALRLAGMVDSV